MDLEQLDIQEAEQLENLFEDVYKRQVPSLLASKKILLPIMLFEDLKPKIEINPGLT